MVGYIKINFLKTILILTIINISCFTHYVDSLWGIQWQFYSNLDSTCLDSNFSWESEIIDLKEGSNNETFKGDLNDSGFLFIKYNMIGTREEVKKNNPSITSKIFYNNKIIFDTSLQWSEMNFKEGYYKPLNVNFQELSELKFYIDLSDSTE